MIQTIAQAVMVIVIHSGFGPVVQPIYFETLEQCMVMTMAVEEQVEGDVFSPDRVTVNCIPIAEETVE